MLQAQDSPLYTNGMVHMEARNNIRFFLEDSRELIWGFDLNERRLFYFDGFDYTYLEPVQDGDLGCLENTAPNQIHEDGEGKLWLLYACGLYLYDPATNQMKSLNVALQEASNRPVLHLYNMFPTRSGDLIFSGQTGIFVYSAKAKAFTFYNANEGYSTGRSITYVAFEDRDGHFFFSNSEEIVEQSAPGKRTIRRFPYLLPLAYQRGLISDGASWMDMIESRKLSVHTYDEKTASIIEDEVMNVYFPLFNQLKRQLQEAIV